jgi:hypothetical protein
MHKSKQRELKEESSLRDIETKRWQNGPRNHPRSQFLAIPATYFKNLSEEQKMVHRQEASDDAKNEIMKLAKEGKAAPDASTYEPIPNNPKNDAPPSVTPTLDTPPDLPKPLPSDPNYETDIVVWRKMGRRARNHEAVKKYRKNKKLEKSAKEAKAAKVLCVAYILCRDGNIVR